jgi:6-phosphogluconate dehydrogenase (decarboxylating)
VGYSNGSQAAFELPGSGIPGSLLDSNATTGLVHNSIGSPVSGRYVFPARSGFAPTPGTVPLLQQPQRVVDTRSSGGPIGTTQSRCFQIAGQAGIPADAVGVLLNATAVGDNAPGWLSLYPAGQSVPGTSTLNFQPGAYAIANGVVTRIGTGGQVCVNVGTISNSPGSADVILDVTGYMTAASVLQLPLLSQPQRLVDTRTSGGPIATGQSRCFTVTGVAGIPADATGVLLNVAGVGYSTRGWLTLYPAGQPVPSTSTLNVDPRAYAIANGAIARIGTNGQVCVNFGTIGNAPGSSNVILDVTGYLTSVASTQMPLLSQPQRLVDTRTSGGPIPSGQTRCFPVGGVAGIPANAVGVVLNVAAVDYATPGWLTVFGAGQPVPTTSSLNFDTSEYAMANGSIMTIGSGGSVCVNVGTPNSTPGAANVILDAVGYLTGVPSLSSASAQGQSAPIVIPKPTPSGS